MKRNIKVFNYSFTSCSKEGQHDSTNVIGEWRWTSSIGGIGGWTLTPKTEGFTKKLKFTDRDFLMFKNDTLIESTVYSLNEINDSIAMFIFMSDKRFYYFEFINLYFINS